MTFTFLMFAVTLQFHGVVGQSAREGEVPLAFTGVKTITRLPGEKILLAGDDGMLYEIVDGCVRSTGMAMKGDFLDFDGTVLRSLGRYTGVWEIDLKTLESRQIIKPCGVRWDIAGVFPDREIHPFAPRCKYVTWDPGGDRIVAYDSRGKELGTLMPSPRREKGSRIESLGFLPGTGDILIVTYWPDMRILRFRADGSQVMGNGWPVRRGMGYLRTSGGRIFHCGMDSIVSIAGNMTYSKRMTVGHESNLTGYAWQGGREFIGTSQGLYVKERGETSFNRRWGGIRRLTALAVGEGFIFMSMGGKIRWMYLDGDGLEPFQSSDALVMRLDNGLNWTDRILDLAVDGKGLLQVAAGKAGRWKFRMTPPLDYANHRRLWTRESAGHCEAVQTKHPSAELRNILESMNIPCGFKTGKIAIDGEWLVVEDTLNHRLLRFKVVSGS